MSEKTLRRGTHQITEERVFRVLTCEIRIATDRPEINEALRYIVHHAHHNLPIECRFAYVVEHHADGYSILEQDVLVTSQLNADAVLVYLFERIQKRASEAMGEWVRIHAGCGSALGKRFLVVGAKYAGKSTLMSSLLFNGMEAFCDDSVLLRDGITLPFPRKFYVREGSLPLLPRLAAIAPRLPFVYSAADGRVVAFDPRDAGFEWHITPAPVDALFWLAPNHGHPTELEPCPKYRMVEQVMTQCNPPAQRDRNWVGDICAMVDHAETYNLHVGELDQALQTITSALGHSDKPKM